MFATKAVRADVLQNAKHHPNDFGLESNRNVVMVNSYASHITCCPLKEFVSQPLQIRDRSDVYIRLNWFVDVINLSSHLFAFVKVLPAIIALAAEVDFSLLRLLLSGWVLIYDRQSALVSWSSS